METEFSEREMRLIRNCITYASQDPAGLPGHNLMIIVAKLAKLSLAKMFVSADKPEDDHKGKRFQLRFDADAQGEPPRILVDDLQEQTTVMEILEEPIALKKEPDSFDDDDWAFPVFSTQTVWLMNEYA